MLRTHLAFIDPSFTSDHTMSSSATFPWTEQLEKTVVSSLCTSFGLDFLLFKDKLGGDVDTVHNVRGGVYATQEEQDRYTERDAYDPKNITKMRRTRSEVVVTKRRIWRATCKTYTARQR